VQHELHYFHGYKVDLLFNSAYITHRGIVLAKRSTVGWVDCDESTLLIQSSDKVIVASLIPFSEAMCGLNRSDWHDDAPNNSVFRSNKTCLILIRE